MATGRLKVQQTIDEKALTNMNKENLTEKLFNDADKSPVDPFDLFEEWFEEAKVNETNDPGAMSFATVDENGMPDVRMLLMNGRDRRGFVVYMNLESAKGRQLMNSPKAAAVFHWKALRRQVRIRGPVEPVSSEEADAYFATRPKGSRIGAHASKQSRPLANREELLKRTKDLEKKYPGDDVPRPDYWSGFRIVPLEIEFWKDGEYRLHDRVVFLRDNPDAPWRAIRLNP